MKVNRSAFLKIMNELKPGLASSAEESEQAICFVFSDGKIITCNDEVAVVQDSPLIDFNGSVHAKEFLALISRAKDEELDIFEKGNELVVKGKRMTAGINVEDVEVQTKDFDSRNVEKWRSLPENFLEAIGFVLFTASTSPEDAPVFGCVHITKEYVETCDKFRATRYQLSSPFKGKEVLIFADAAKELVKYEVKKYGIKGSWAHFKTSSGAVLSCRLFDSAYTDLDNLFNNTGRKEVPFPDLKEVVSRAQLFVSQDRESPTSSMITITLEKGKLLVYGENKEVGWFKEKVKMDYTGDSVSFRVPPQFMSQASGLVKSAYLGDRSFTLKGDRFQHVVAIASAQE